MMMHLLTIVLILGYLKGGDTLRLLHSHSDACLTIPSAKEGEELQKSVKQTMDVFTYISKNKALCLSGVTCFLF